MLKKIDHIGIAVWDLDQAIDKYAKLFNAHPKIIENLEDLSVQIAFIPVGEVMIELAAPLGPNQGRIAKFLEEKGEGFHHIAYRVEDLEKELQSMQTAGVVLRDYHPRAGGAGSKVAFISPEETNNVLTELVERIHDL